ncbi:MAG: PQQ-binding-like beta-propeller repeat protein, partial [Thermoplasmata archaeon]
MKKGTFACMFASILIVGVMFASSFVSAEVIAPKGDWPMFNYDSRHSGFNKTVQNVPRTNFTIWKSPKLDGPFDNIQPIVFNGTIYVGTSSIGGSGGQTKGVFYALDEQTGAVKWKVTDITKVLSSAVVHATSTEEYVIFGCDNSHVMAVHAKNGTLVWKYDASGAGAKIDAHLTYNAKKKNVYFTTMTYVAVTASEGNYTLRCYALNAKTGQPDSDWQTNLGARPYWEFQYAYEDMIPGLHQASTPAVDYESGLIFLASAYAEKISGTWRKWGKLFAVDLTTGKTKWIAELDALPNAGPVVGTDHVYVGTENGTIYAFPKIEPDPQNGIMEETNLYWLYQCRDWDMKPMPITNGMVLAKLTKPANREVLIFGTGGPKNVANGRLYALDAHGTKDASDGYGFKPSVENGLSTDLNISAEILWFYQWDGDQNLKRSIGFEKGPCAAGGMVYIAGQTQQLYCFQLNG